MVTKRTLYSWVLERNVRWQLLLMLTVLLTVFVRVVPLELQKRIINKAIGRGDADLLLLYSLLFIASVLLASSLKYGINLLQAYIGQQTLQRMRKDLYAHVLSLPLSFFRTIQPGQVVNSIINEMASISGFIGSAVSVPLINVCTLLAMGGYLFYLNPLLAGLSFVLYPLQIVIVPKLQMRSNNANRFRVKISRTISGNIGEVITGVHEVHAHAGYGLENRKFSNQAKSLLDANIRMNTYRYGIKFANNLFQNIGPFILFLVGGTMTIRGHFDLGALIAFLSAYSSLNEPWQELMEFYQLLEDSKVRYKNVMAVFDVLPEHPVVPIGRAAYELAGNIDVLDMSYLANDGTKILDGIRLHIRHGEMVALVGFSGSGKSTLVQIIGQLLSYQRGNVLFDGQEVSSLTKTDIARNLGMVPQHPFIFSGSIKDNLLYAMDAVVASAATDSGHPDPEQLIEVVQQVGLFVDVLKFGSHSLLSPQKDHEMVQKVLALRASFRERFERELASDIEFFASDKYLEYGSIAQNIIFGDFADHLVETDKAYENSKFLNFLEQFELMGILVEFGVTITQATVPILKFAAQTPELFENSPISAEELQTYIQIVAEIEARGRRNLKGASRSALLKLALGFVPGRHKTVKMPELLKARLLHARADFRKYLGSRPTLGFQYYDREQYIQLRSIRDNIIFGQPKTSRGGALDRISQSLLKLFIEAGVLENIIARGLNFQVGSMGEYLSGGQRQKLSLARVLLKRPSVFILDEATAALDNASQTRVQNLLQALRGRHTIISVVHRLDTITDYDRIVVMKGGKIVESGPYSELMASQGALYELVGSA